MAVANLVGGVLCFGVTKLIKIYKGPNEGLFEASFVWSSMRCL